MVHLLLVMPSVLFSFLFCALVREKAAATPTAIDAAQSFKKRAYKNQ
jgi:hypothetical protein